MDLKLLNFGDKGNITSERIGLKVLKDCDLKYYLVVRSVFQTDSFINRGKDWYWFSPRLVKQGDTVVLYSKGGTDSLIKNPDGSTTYFFYWGLTTAVFTSNDFGVVLAEAKFWDWSKSLS
jgi:hypothetical protein